jgi:putative membrane protein
MSSDIPLDAAPSAAQRGSDESLGQQRTDLAYERTTEAADRTLMAGVRTAVSMISFGFTIAKFFQFMDKLTPSASTASELGHSPHHLGLVLLGGGTLTVLFALVEYSSYMRHLHQLDAKTRQARTALFAAIFVLAVGVVLSVLLIIDLMSIEAN